MKFSIRTMIMTLVIAAAVLAGAFAMFPKPLNVEVASVIEGPLRVSVQEDGVTRIREKYIVSAPVAGRLSRIKLKAGDQILDNQSALATIMPTEPAMLDARAQAQAEARVRSAEAALERAKANAEQARLNNELAETKYDRAAQLLQENAISRNEFDVASSQYKVATQATRSATFESDVATFELEMARAAVKQFAGTGDDSPVDPFQIRAPIAGKVLRVFQESSTVVNLGTPLMEIGDPRNLEIEIDVLSTDAVRIKPGAEITVEHWGGELPLRGKVRVIEPAAFTKVSSLGVEEQRVNIIADFSDDPERFATLGDGYRVEARITIEQTDNTLRIPNSALFRHQRQWHVFAVKDGIAQMQQVTIGIQNESQTQIVEGLSSGDNVIVYPSDQVENGTRVTAVSFSQ